MAYKKRRSRLNKKMGRRRQRSSWKSCSLAPVLSIGAVVLSVAALAALTFFLVIPLLSGKLNKPAESKPPVVSAPAKDPNAVADLSPLEKEAVLQQKSINSPYIFGKEMVYSTGDKNSLNPSLKNICIFNLETKKTTTLDNIKYKDTNSNLFEPQMNEKWIVFLDQSTKGGGRVCGYDRKNDKMFVIRDYAYGMPKLRLSGDYVAWMQQTGLVTDKLYICSLPENESVCVTTYKEAAASMIAPYLCEKELIWVEAANSEGGASEDMKCIIKRMPIAEGKAGEVTSFDPQLYVFDPITDGTNILFLDAPRGQEARLMLSSDGAVPKEIAKGVLNYGMGDGFVAYTKDENVFVYNIKTGERGKLTGKNTRGELSTVVGTMICWYDTTDGALVRDVIKYAEIPADFSTVTPENTPSDSESPSDSATGSESPSESPTDSESPSESPSESEEP